MVREIDNLRRRPNPRAMRSGTFDRIDDGREERLGGHGSQETKRRIADIERLFGVTIFKCKRLLALENSRNGTGHFRITPAVRAATHRRVNPSRVKTFETPAYRTAPDPQGVSARRRPCPTSAAGQIMAGG